MTVSDDGVEIGHHATHPEWCDPLSCQDDGSYAHHASATVTLTLGGERYEFELRRLDEHRHPDEPGETRLRVDVTETEVVDCATAVEIPVQHLDALIARLTIERNRARFHGSPVVQAVAS